uniref:MFS domain-containing protein n=1 Tax=Caenorhabditis tropicalis TaxID=1561998 RepID=A0A1I7U7D2_9PELO
MSGRISNRSVVVGVRDAVGGGSSDDKDNPNEFDALYADSQNSSAPNTSPILLGNLEMRCKRFRLNLSMKHRIRWVIFMLTWLQLGSVMNCVDVFSFSMVYMEKNSTIASEAGQDDIYIYTLEEKSSLISAMAIGSLIGMYPQNSLMQKYGARVVMTVASLLCALITSFMPWALDKHYNVALVFRILQGVLYSADFGVVGYVVSKWSPIQETGLSLAALSGFTAARAVIQLPMAGWTTSNIGWRPIYYLLSIVLFLSTIVWFFFYRDDPEDHCLMTHSELQHIGGGTRTKKPRFHTEKLFSTSHFVFLVYGAQYYQYLGMDIQANAWLNSMKGYIFIGVRIVAGLASDRIHSLPETSKLRLFNTISLQLPAFFLILVVLLPREHPYLHVICITFYQASFGFNCGGFYKGAALISRQFSYFVIGYIQLFKSLATLLEPVLFSLLVLPGSEDSELSWTSYFLIHALTLTVANTVYVIFARSEPADFVVNSDLELSKPQLPCETSNA